ncbi:S8 family serine peptidase [Streptomyces sp. NPDC008061]|uniref:S8 family serine peptidase n=1 Tax=Streptomyces sp. NPDC008061 TaxID=3364805 RepID=UPI0036EA581F
MPGPCRPLHARDDPRYRPRSAGAGVRVAVLDSGADTSHPDLAKRIMASRSFVPGENVTDRNGHDTHTAHLGRDGRCLGGKKRGITPDAYLLVPMPPRGRRSVLWCQPGSLPPWC